MKRNNRPPAPPSTQKIPPLGGISFSGGEGGI